MKCRSLKTQEINQEYDDIGISSESMTDNDSISISSESMVENGNSV